MTGRCRRVIGAACLVAGLSLGGTSLAGPSAARESGGDPAVTFMLVTARKPDSPDRQRAALIIELNGQPAGRHDLAAIIDGPLLPRFLAPLDPGSSPRSWRADVILDLPAENGPAEGTPPSGRAEAGASRKNFHRLNVTFTRVQGMSVVPFLRRPVYLNLAPVPERILEDPPPLQPAADPPALPDPPPPPVPAPAPSSSADRAAVAPEPLPGIEREPVAPLHEEPIVETALPLPATVAPPLQPVAASTEYWHQAEQRVTARFKQHAKGKAARTRPRVRFRLYHDGIARTIFLERSSGNAAVDQAGLDSVMDAHPFPPFPDDVAEPYVDVHVDFSSKRR